MWTAGSWLLHHDNTPTHTVLSIRQFFAKDPIPTIPQPPYSSNISPPEFFLFPKLKITLKERRFQRVDDIITNVTNDLKAKPQTSSKQRFLKWKRRWDRFIAVQGNYFEGDNIQ
jgi:transposase